MAKYLKPGAEEQFTEDITEIQYLKFNMARHVALGYMLGDFDERGEYNIDPEIVRELIFMPKHFVESMENIDICHSQLTLNAPLTFLVTFEQDTATLSLIEKISYEGNFKFNSGSYSNINEYILDVVATNGNINKEAIYRRWNIGQFGGEALDIRNLDEEQLEAFYGLATRFKYLTYVNAMFAEKEAELEAAETQYSNDMLHLLEQYPELRDAVNEQLKDALDKTEILRLDKPNFAKTLNEVIDTAIDFNIQQLSPEKQKEFATLRGNIQQARNVKVEQTIPIEISHVDLNNKETAIGTPKVQTFNAEATLSLYALDELVKAKQATAEQQAQARAVDVALNNKKSNATKLPLMLGLTTLANILGGSVGRNILENVDEKLKAQIEALKKTTTPKSMLGKAAAQEQKADSQVNKQAGATTPKTTVANKNSKANKSAKPAATNKAQKKGSTTKTSGSTTAATNKNKTSSPYIYNKDKGERPKAKSEEKTKDPNPNKNLRNEIEERLAKLRGENGETAIGTNRQPLIKKEVGKVSQNDNAPIRKQDSEKQLGRTSPSQPKIGGDVEITTTEIGLTK